MLAGPLRRLDGRSILVVLFVLVAVAAVIAGILRLQAHAAATSDAELRLTSLRLDLMQMRDVPWGAFPDEGGDPEAVRSELLGAQEKVESTLAQLREDPGLPAAERIEGSYGRTKDALWALFEAAKAGDHEAANEASGPAAEEMYAADEALSKAAAEYGAVSARALLVARLGTILAIGLLFAAFAVFFVRARSRRRAAESLAGENRRLLELSRVEAVTDSLTGLGNRRALVADLSAAEPARPGEQVLLGLFDLDGFKQYNDTFGHPAGDALLARLSERLRSTTAGVADAYRMGGDEFCILASVEPESAAAIAALAASALADAGEGFEIGCSYGYALVPSEAGSPEGALGLADQRMYRHKRSGRVSPTRQSADVLLKLLEERSSELGQHTSGVAELAEQTALRLDVAVDECARIRLAAELHDVGKAAIPDAILNKPGALDAEEWSFIRRHSVIGERIVRAAPSLAHTAELVRSHHERHDGTGYPDGLAGGEIPLGARVIAVSDAYDAMIADRPYRAGLSAAEAIAELRRGAGTQFDPAVVTAFLAVLAEQAPSAAAAAAYTEARAGDPQRPE